MLVIAEQQVVEPIKLAFTIVAQLKLLEVRFAVIAKVQWEVVIFKAVRLFVYCSLQLVVNSNGKGLPWIGAIESMSLFTYYLQVVRLKLEVVEAPLSFDL